MFSPSFGNLRSSGPRKFKGKATQRRQGTNANGPRAPRLQRNEVILRGTPGFKALEYRTKLYYYDYAQTISSGVSTAGTRVYSTNGLYDPDITGTGHQPMRFDEMMLAYEHFVCHGAVIKVTFKNTSTTVAMVGVLSLNASATALTDIQRLIESGVNARVRCGMYPYEGAVQLLALPCDVGRFGAVRNLLDNPSYEGSSSANPVEQSYFHISWYNPETVSSVDTIIDVEIVYDVTFREPRKQPLSLEQYRADLALYRLQKTLRREENKSQTPTH